MIALLTLAGLASAQDYSFPTTAADYSSWYPTTYFDHAGRDYTCGTDRYSGHSGSDFGAGSWAGMNAGRSITAAAAGTVTAVHDGEVDTCTGNCSSPANLVQIAHPDGKVTVYGHLKRWSIPVSVGDTVSCGQVIGEMGSSGMSSGPHLHFSAYVNQVITDPFNGSCNSSPSLWVSQGPYQGVPGRTCDSSYTGSTGGSGGSGFGCGALNSGGQLAFLMLAIPAGWFRRRRTSASV